MVLLDERQAQAAPIGQMQVFAYEHIWSRQA